MNKQQLAAKIWEAANKMRSKIDANEYKDYILGFIFYKFLSEKELKFLRENDFDDESIAALDESDAEIVGFVQRNIGYFIPYKYLFSTWIEEGSDFSAGEVTDALQSFERLVSAEHEKLFDGVFQTLAGGLSHLGETSGARTKAVSDLLYLIRTIPMDGRQDYDVLGFIYEYLIGNFAANAGKKAGEFYTPHEVSLLMSEIVAAHLADRKEIKIYDPTSGSGSLLINIGKSAARYMGTSDRIKYYAQELKENTYNLTRMNLIMRGIDPANITTRNGDTLKDDWPYFDESDPQGTYDPLFVDAVVSNPPYSQAWDPADMESDPRFAGFGVAPRGAADYAFLLHDLYHLRADGIMTIVLPHGVLFRGGSEETIRRNLIEKNHIDAVIGLPANIFFGTGIPTIIMVLKKQKKDSSVLIIDASKGFEKVGKNNKLRARDIRKIADAVLARKTIPKFSRLVSLEELRANGCNLNIPRYVDSSEPAETWDLSALFTGGVPERELDALADEWAAFPQMKDALFARKNDTSRTPRADDLAAVVESHPDTAAFRAACRGALSGLAEDLYASLVLGWENVELAKEEPRIAEGIFRRLAPLPLIDRYEAYQLLDDAWRGISADIEMLQTEGWETVRRTDPHMVMKKKKGKDVEVQEGWEGRLLPFPLVQKEMLAEDLAALGKKRAALEEAEGAIEELLEGLTDDIRQKEFVNEAGDAFVEKEAKKAVKQKTEEEEVLRILAAALALLEKGKKLRKEIRAAEDALHEKTKKTVETIEDDAARKLLSKKWIDPLTEALAALPETAVGALAEKASALAEKYAETLPATEAALRAAEKDLAAMTGRLTGSASDEEGLAALAALLGGE